MYGGLRPARFFFALLADYVEVGDVHVLDMLGHVQKNFDAAALFPCVNVRVAGNHVGVLAAP